MPELQTAKLQPIQLPLLPDTPLVSVLIANYNYAQYISETIESVLCQTYPHFEIIVCDDGSSDNSCEVIETYVQKDSRIKLIRQPNGGVAKALNAAYRESQGQIICLLDADDTWLDTKLAKVVQIFKSQQKCGFAIHNVIEIDGQGNFLTTSPKMKHLASGWMAPYALANGGFVKHIPPASALSFRREITNLIFPVNPVIVRNTDTLILRLAPLITEIGSVPEVLSKFRIHGANITSTKNLNVDVLERGQVHAKLIYKEQQQFLQNFYGSEIAEQLTGQYLNINFCHEFYLLSRLKGISKSERRKLHQQLVTHPEFSQTFPWKKPNRWLLRYDWPDALFTFLFQQIYGMSYLKRFVKWLAQKKPSASLVRG